MKILVTIPCVINGVMVREAIESFKHKDVSFYLIDNGADIDVKEVLRDYCVVQHNEKNIYVNPAWNQGLAYFLGGHWDIIIIANSDVVMLPGWIDALEILREPFTVCSPTLDEINCDYDGGAIVPGHCMCLTREAAKLVFPIPSDLNIWFGDSWIFGRLAKLGWRIMVLKNMKARHHYSFTIKSLDFSDIIEQDKLAWERVKRLI